MRMLGATIGELRKRSGRSRAQVAQRAGVVEGTGFMTAMIRAAGTGVALIAKPKFPLKIVATVPDAAAWMTMTLRWHEGEARALIDAIEDLRARSLAQ